MVNIINHRQTDKVRFYKYLSTFEELLQAEGMKYRYPIGNEEHATIYCEDPTLELPGPIARILVHPTFTYLGRTSGSLEIAIDSEIAEEKAYLDKLLSVTEKLQAEFDINTTLHKYINMGLA